MAIIEAKLVDPKVPAIDKTTLVLDGNGQPLLLYLSGFISPVAGKWESHGIHVSVTILYLFFDLIQFSL